MKKHQQQKLENKRQKIGENVKCKKKEKWSNGAQKFFFVQSVLSVLSTQRKNERKKITQKKDEQNERRQEKTKICTIFSYLLFATVKSAIVTLSEFTIEIRWALKPKMKTKHIQIEIPITHTHRILQRPTRKMVHVGKLPEKRKLVTFSSLQYCSVHLILGVSMDFFSALDEVK